MTGGAGLAPAREDRGGKWARTWRLHREAKKANKLEILGHIARFRNSSVPNTIFQCLGVRGT